MMLKLKWFWMSLLLGLLWGQAASAQNAAKPTGTHYKYKAILVWGTDGDKPDGQDLKDLEEPVLAKLKKIFKWKNYFEVNSKNFTITAKETQKVTLSPKCDIEIKFDAADALEVEMIGEGRVVSRVKKAMPYNEWIVLGGDDKNSTAWFVLLIPEAE